MFSKIIKFLQFNKPQESNTEEEVKEASEVVESNEIDNLSINNTDLTTRTVNCLLANGIDTIGKLKQLNLTEFETRKQVGKKTVDEIKTYLEQIGINSVVYVAPSDKVIANFDNKPNVEEQLSYKCVEIDERVFQVKIRGLNLNEKLINTIENNNIFTLEDFINNRASIELKPKEIELLYKEIEKFGINRTDEYKPVHIETPQNYYLNVEEVFNDNWIINACKHHELKNIGLLASVFPEVFIQDDELASQEIFFDKITLIENKLKELGILKTPIDLSYFQKKELSKKDNSELIGTNHIELLGNVIYDTLKSNNLSNETTKRNRAELSEKEIDVIIKRYGLGVTKQTLDEIGQSYGCSRERIRQLESKAISKIVALALPKFRNINEEINQLLNGLGNILCYQDKDNSDIDELLKIALDKFEDKCFDINFDSSIVLKKGLLLDNIYKNLLDNYSNSKLYNLSQIEQDFNELLSSLVLHVSGIQNFNYTRVYKKLFPLFLNNNFSKIDENLYKYISTNTGRKSKKGRDEKLIYWFEKLYPNGVHMPIEKEKEEQLKQSLQPLYDKCEEIKKLGVRSVADRLIKNNRDVIWWGRGLYIHVNNISINWDVVDTAINEVIKRFDNGLHRIKPNAIYDENKDKYINAGIPNELALVGLIKYRNNPRININRDELRDSENSNLDHNILEAFETFILKYPEGISKKDLINEMCNKRGWLPHQIEFLYNRSSQIYKDEDIYFHRNNFFVNERRIIELINIIQQELNSSESPFMHLRKIKNAYPEVWYSIINRNISPSFMGRLISSKISNQNFVIDNYVYAKKTEHFAEGITLDTIIEQYVREKSLENKCVPISEIIEYCQKQGLIYLKQSIVDSVEKVSFEYANETYVHHSAIGYSDSFQEDLFVLMQILSENKSGTPLIKYDDVISNYSGLLPILNEGYEWNYFLLRSALRKDENIDTFDKTFIFKDNSFGVEDLDDTAAYLMVKNYENCCCSFKELDKLMADYGVTPAKCLHFYKSRLFFEGSSIRAEDNENAVTVEQFAIEKYSNK